MTTKATQPAPTRTDRRAVADLRRQSGRRRRARHNVRAQKMSGDRSNSPAGRNPLHHATTGTASCQPISAALPRRDVVSLAALSASPPSTRQDHHRTCCRWRQFLVWWHRRLLLLHAVFDVCKTNYSDNQLNSPSATVSHCCIISCAVYIWTTVQMMQSNRMTDIKSPIVGYYCLTYSLSNEGWHFAGGGTGPGHWISRYSTEWPILCWCAMATRSRPPHWLYLQDLIPHWSNVQNKLKWQQR